MGSKPTIFTMSQTTKWASIADTNQNGWITFMLETIHKIPAYGRHGLSLHVRIVAPILWNPAFLTLFCTFGHFIAFFVVAFVALFVTFLALFFLFYEIMCHVSRVTCRMWHVTCHITHVTCHLPPLTNANSHRPSPADSPIIHSRLVPDPKNS